MGIPVTERMIFPSPRFLAGRVMLKKYVVGLEASVSGGLRPRKKAKTMFVLKLTGDDEDAYDETDLDKTSFASVRCVRE